MKIFKISLLITLSLALSFCRNDKKSSETISKENSKHTIVEVDTNTEDTVYPEPVLEAKFKNEKTEEAYKLYSKLQNALVNTNAAETSKNAAILAESLMTINAEEEVLNVVISMANSQDIEVQRTQFVALTAAMEKMLEGALDDGMLYKMYCPMAFNNTGAYWLSSDKKVQNPYFGDKMLTCGRVENEIK